MRSWLPVKSESYCKNVFAFFHGILFAGIKIAEVFQDIYKKKGSLAPCESQAQLFAKHNFNAELSVFLPLSVKYSISDQNFISVLPSDVLQFLLKSFFFLQQIHWNHSHKFYYLHRDTDN